MTIRRIWLAIIMTVVVGLLTVFTALASAQTSESMSQEQKDRMHDKWENMSEEEQDEIRGQMRELWRERWENMSEEERQERRERWESMEDEERREYFRTRLYKFILEMTEEEAGELEEVTPAPDQEKWQELAEPSYYVKKDSWQDTMLASREALMQQEQAKEVGRPLPNFGESDFTLMAWVKTAADGGTIVTKAPARGNWEPLGKALFLREGGLAFDVAWIGAVESDVKVNDGEWHHVALAKSRGLEFYVDGKPAGGGTLRMGSDKPSHVLKIGYCTSDFPQQSGFEGEIDELRIYNRKLSASQIVDIYENSGEVSEALAGHWSFEQGAIDVSGNENHGKVYGAVAGEGKIGQALGFDGESSVVLSCSAATAVRNEIWPLINRDFTDEKSVKEIEWEQQDKIWSSDWQLGDYKGIARRYVQATRDIGGLAEKARQELAVVESAYDLEVVRKLYLLSRTSDEAYVSLRQQLEMMRDEIEYLDENFDETDSKWLGYKSQLPKLEKRAGAVLEKLAERDESRTEELMRLAQRADRLHKQVPIKLPSGPAGPGRFGAYYIKLKYSLEWDKPWRVGPQADVVVRFDEGGHKFVFWRGTSYIPCWVTDAGVWYTNEFVERRGHHSPNTEGCVEPMSDKQCRFSHVRIIESNDARVVVHWRYAPVDVRYEHPFIDPLTGWSDWVDEYYTIYPDGVAVRKITVYTTRPDLWTEFQEAIVVNQPGTMPDDSIELGAVSLANMQGESKTYYWTEEGGPDFGEPEAANIVKINIKGTLQPFALVAPAEDEGILITPYEGHGRGSHFNFWNHWPVSQVASDGRMASSADRPSHSSLCHIGLPGMATATWKDYAQGDEWRTRIMLHGLTDKPAADLVPLAKSWLNAPELKLKKDWFGLFGGLAFTSSGYDPTQAAYVLTCKKPGQPSKLEFELMASKDSPVVNPAFVIEKWGVADAALKINGKVVECDKEFRKGRRQTTESNDLIVWLKREATKPITILLLPVTD